MLSSSVVPHVSISMRQVGARIAAGIADLTMAAELLGISVQEYRSYETGTYPAPKLEDRIARVFGVSNRYIVSRSVVNERERLADVIAKGLAEYEAKTWQTGKAASQHFPATLVAMRAKAGYASAMEAAAALSWNATLYASQEAGERQILPDQLCFYAVAFGMRPDAALLGDQTVLWRPGETIWWRIPRWSEHSASGALVSPAFDWLAAGNCATNVLELPLVEFVQGKWILQEEKISVARALVPPNAVTVGDTLYAMVDRKPHAVRVVLTDPTKSGHSCVVANRLGELRVRELPAADIVDPTAPGRRKKGDYFTVGAHVATLGTRREMPIESSSGTLKPIRSPLRSHGGVGKKLTAG